ncbi:MAG: lipid-transfer protein [Sphingobium sp.]|nr:lipid-transfer protein [Sphingobium sp.]
MTGALVAGVGMVKFAKPGANEPYRVMAAAAIRQAIEDAGIAPADIGQAYGGYIYGDSACAQHALYDVMMTGIPIVNVNNNCSSGSTALFLARQAVESGAVECALAFGFEEMPRGAMKSNWDDRESPGGAYVEKLDKWDYPEAPGAPRLFGAAGDYYMKTYDAKPDLFAQVAVKSRLHSTKNPMALFDQELTVEEVMASPLVYGDYLTRLMCCPPTCGAAAAILCTPAFAKRHGLDHAVEIIGQGMASDTDSAWDNPMRLVGWGATNRAAKLAFEQAGLGPDDVDVVELHDCFTTNEVVSYEALGLCAEGGATKLVADGDNTYGGKWVVNPSGGLMSKGHPIGATGLAQCYELCMQMRNQAGTRQVERARVGLQHNIGVPGVAVVTLYRALA